MRTRSAPAISCVGVTADAKSGACGTQVGRRFIDAWVVHDAVGDGCYVMRVG
jgi:hypothetical protein